MARTVSNKRGSVRGAPPDVYMAFSTFGDGDEDNDRVIGEVVDWTKSMLMAAIWFIVIMLGIFVWTLIFDE